MQQTTVPTSMQTTPALPALIAGCLLVGSSSTFIKLAEVNANTAAFLRCALALVVLGPVAYFEWRRHGAPPRNMVLLGVASGVFLGIDYTMWTQSILDTGAAVATVLIGVQVVVFPLLGWLFFGERVPRKFAIGVPVMLVGLALTGGVLGADDAAPHPARGAILGILAGVAYAGYLFFNKQSAGVNHRCVVTPVFLGTAAAAVVIGMAGTAMGDLDLALSVHAWWWMAALAFGGQVLSFVLIGYGSLRMASGRAAAILLLQPVAAIVLGAIVLREGPDVWQYLGMAVTVTAVAVVTVRRRLTLAA